LRRVIRSSPPSIRQQSSTRPVYTRRSWSASCVRSRSRSMRECTTEAAAEAACFNTMSHQPSSPHIHATARPKAALWSQSLEAASPLPPTSPPHAALGATRSLQLLSMTEHSFVRRLGVLAAHAQTLPLRSMAPTLRTSSATRWMVLQRMQLSSTLPHSTPQRHFRLRARLRQFRHRHLPTPTRASPSRTMASGRLKSFVRSSSQTAALCESISTRSQQTRAAAKEAAD